jgi:hypothetical protein
MNASTLQSPETETVRSCSPFSTIWDSGCSSKSSKSSTTDSVENGCPCLCGDCQCAYCCCADCSEYGQCNCDEPCRCPGLHCAPPCGGCCADCTCPPQKPPKRTRRWSDAMFRLSKGPGRGRLERYAKKDTAAKSHQVGRCNSAGQLFDNLGSEKDLLIPAESDQVRTCNSAGQLFDNLGLRKDLPVAPEPPIVYPAFVRHRFNFSWVGRRRPGGSSRWNPFSSPRSMPPAQDSPETPDRGNNEAPTQSELSFQSSTSRESN